MNFTYEDKKETRECVAVIWRTHLVVKSYVGNAVMFYGPNAAAPTALYTPASRDWGYYEGEAEHKFYRGDKVTIEF